MKEFKTVSICVTTYLLLCLLVLSILLIFMSQFSNIDDYNLSGKISYILYIFDVYFLIEPINLFTGVFFRLSGILLMNLEK